MRHLRRPFGRQGGFAKGRSGDFDAGGRDGHRHRARAALCRHVGRLKRANVQRAPVDFGVLAVCGVFGRAVVYRRAVCVAFHRIKGRQGLAPLDRHPQQRVVPGQIVVDLDGMGPDRAKIVIHVIADKVGIAGFREPFDLVGPIMKPVVVGVEVHHDVRDVLRPHRRVIRCIRWRGVRVGGRRFGLQPVKDVGPRVYLPRIGDQIDRRRIGVAGQHRLDKGPGRRLEPVHPRVPAHGARDIQNKRDLDIRNVLFRLAQGMRVQLLEPRHAQKERVQGGLAARHHCPVGHAFGDPHIGQRAAHACLGQIVGDHGFGRSLLVKVCRRQHGVIQRCLHRGAHGLVAHDVHGRARHDQNEHQYEHGKDRHGSAVVAQEAFGHGGSVHLSFLPFKARGETRARVQGACASGRNSGHKSGTCFGFYESLSRNP